MHYFKGKISQAFIYLFISRAILNVAVGFFGVFMPIFLFDLFDQKITSVALFFMSASIFYALFIGLSAQMMNRFGFRRALRISVIFGALYYLGFYFLETTRVNVAWWLIPLIVFMLVLWRLFYWLPYQVDFAKFSSKKNRAKEVGMNEAVLSAIGIFTPIIAGFIIDRIGFGFLFSLGVFLYLSAFFPYLKIPRTKEKFSWTYKQTWQEFFAKKNRGQIMAFMADGAEGAIGAVIWPIFIYQLLNGDYVKVGMISTFVIAITVVLQLFAGRYTDGKKDRKKKIIKWASLFYSLAWVFKIFVGTAFQIFIIDSAHRFSRIFLRIPFDAMAYDFFADQGHFVDEYTAIKEMAVAIGRIFAYAFVILTSFFLSLNWLFLLAAFVSLMFNFLSANNKNNANAAN